MSLNPKIPVVQIDDTGKFSIELPPKCALSWRMVRLGGEEHYIIDLKVPENVPIHELPEGYAFSRSARH